MQSAAGVNVAVKGSIDMAADYVVILMIQFRKVSFNLGLLDIDILLMV